MRYFLLILLSLGVIMGLYSDDVKYPFAQKVAYQKGVELSRDREVVVKNIQHYYEKWKEDFLIQEGEYYRIATDKKNTSRTVSEGQGYGMLITALMAGYDENAKKIFDGLYLFSRAHPSALSPLFMTWQVPAKKGESDSAFDGDADIAYALLLASKQWGNQGKIAYNKEADKIIQALLKSVVGKSSYLPLLGDWVEEDGKKYNQFTTRSSDFMLSHFRTFYRITKDKQWLEVIKATQDALLEIQNLPENKTALVSDFIVKKGGRYYPEKRGFLEEEDDAYYYNACRVPMRVGLDALLNGDKTSLVIVQKMAQWIAKKSGKNPDKIMSGYRLDGSVIGEYTSAVFIAPFAVAVKCDPTLQGFFDKLYDAIKDRHENYYEDSINLLSQLIMIDAFWDPSKVK